MRYLILSDLHSNDEALTAVLRRVKRKTFDRVVCLGDFVGYAADPNKVLDRFRKLRRTTISMRGNHDKVVAGVEEGLLFNPPALEAVRWTVEPPLEAEHGVPEEDFRSGPRSWTGASSCATARRSTRTPTSSRTSTRR